MAYIIYTFSRKPVINGMIQLAFRHQKGAVDVSG